MLQRVVVLLAFLLGAPTAAYAKCGGANQRPCKVFERVPSCNKGLVEDFKKNRCVRRKKPQKPKPRKLNCGKQNQRPCLVTERVPSCNKGLVENFRLKRCVKPKPGKRKLNCGKKGQRPCRLGERLPSCNKGLVEDFAVDRCLPPNRASGKTLERKFTAFAKGFVRDNKRVAQSITRFAESLTKGKVGRYFSSGRFKKDVEGRRIANITRNIDMSGIRRNLAKVKGRLPQTITIGVVTEGGVGIGGSVELGVAFDISPRGGPAVIYRTFGVNMGLITGGSASIAVAFYMKNPKQFVGEARGFSFAAGRSVFQGASVGGSLGFWFEPYPDFPGGVGFDYRKFAGLGVAVSIGATVLPVDLRGSAALTQRVNRGGRWVADGCGAQRQRPCHVVERVPSCNRGLREDFVKHLCIR